MSTSSIPSFGRPAGPQKLLPWLIALICAVVAISALVRCVLNESENEVLTQRVAMAEASIKAAQTQTEAERLVSGGMAGQLRAPRLTVRFLVSPTNGSDQIMGALVCAASAHSGLLRTEHLPATTHENHYELWSSAPHAVRLTTFTIANSGTAEAAFEIDGEIPSQWAIFRVRNDIAETSLPPDRDRVLVAR